MNVLSRSNEPSVTLAPSPTPPAGPASLTPAESGKSNILLVYEDLPTGLRAKEVMDRIVRQLGSVGELRPRLFRFNLMRVPGFAEWTTKEREQVDLVVLSAHGGRLPEEVVAWLNLWFRGNPQRRLMLVIVFDAAAKLQPEAARALADLSLQAREAGVNVLTSLGNVMVPPNVIHFAELAPPSPVPPAAMPRAAVPLA
jgi:hypothetical protein